MRNFTKEVRTEIPFPSVRIQNLPDPNFFPVTILFSPVKGEGTSGICLKISRERICVCRIVFYLPQWTSEIWGFKGLFPVKTESRPVLNI